MLISGFIDFKVHWFQKKLLRLKVFKQQHQDFWVHKESLKPHNIDIICCYAFFSLQFPLTNIAVLCLTLMVCVPIPPQTFNWFIYQQNIDNLLNKNSGNIFHLGLYKRSRCQREAEISNTEWQHLLCHILQELHNLLCLLAKSLNYKDIACRNCMSLNWIL